MPKGPGTYGSQVGRPRLKRKKKTQESIYSRIGNLVSEGGFVKAAKSIERRGTEGDFTEYCGGKVTDDCIQRALKSGGRPAKMAQFAKAARSVAKDNEGEE